MTRLKRVPGEKPLFWVGSSRDDLLAFPATVQDDIGTALSVAQHFDSTADPGGRTMQIVGRINF